MPDEPASRDGQDLPPACFVLMPFGRRPDVAGGIVDFDAVWSRLIAPAVRDAGLTPVRADEEIGDLVHEPVFERLLLTDCVVADLTSASARTFFELGARYAVRPFSTVLLFAASSQQPFHLEGHPSIPYAVSAAGGPADIEATRKRLADQLTAMRNAPVNPILQLVEGVPNVSRLNTDVFRAQASYSQHWKDRLAKDRALGIDAVRAAEYALGPLHDVEAGILIDLFLSYRAVGGYEEMVSLAERFPRALARATMVQEQRALALSRIGRRDEAERVLLDRIREGGPSSETYSILGGMYNAEWKEAVRAGETFLAKGSLDRAIDAYLKGFDADPRDTYPGISAVTLMELRDPPDQRRVQLIPVVSYAVERRLASEGADYWDNASRLEIAVLAKDEEGARSALTQTLDVANQQWQLAFTADTLKLIREARERRADVVPWAAVVERELLRKAGSSGGAEGDAHRPTGRPGGVPRNATQETRYVTEVGARSAPAEAAERLRTRIEIGDYDVFLCHNSRDKEHVIAIAQRLKDRGILPWLDIWDIQPGKRWQQELKRNLKSIKSVAVFIGSAGSGPWQDLEIESSLQHLAKQGRPIIPVILESRKGKPRFPGFLDMWQVVDMRKPDPDPFELLVWGITGQRYS